MGQVLDNISQFADEIRADGVEGDKLMRLTDGSAKR
ncbi:MAG: putative hydroxylase, partial [Rhodococcus erythropolis]|nr:putative hydroxylase [Rhodococcus erythropolis]